MAEYQVTRLTASLHQKREALHLLNCLMRYGSDADVFIAAVGISQSTSTVETVVLCAYITLSYPSG